MRWVREAAGAAVLLAGAALLCTVALRFDEAERTALELPAQEGEFEFPDTRRSEVPWNEDWEPEKNVIPRSIGYYHIEEPDQAADQYGYNHARSDGRTFWGQTYPTPPFVDHPIEGVDEIPAGIEYYHPKPLGSEADDYGYNHARSDARTSWGQTYPTTPFATDKREDDSIPEGVGYYHYKEQENDDGEGGTLAAAVAAWNPIKSPELPLVRDQADTIQSGVNYYSGVGTSDYDEPYMRDSDYYESAYHTAYPNMPDLENWRRGGKALDWKDETGRHPKQSPLDFKAHYLADDFLAHETPRA